MTFVKTVQTPVAAKNKTDSVLGPVFQKCLTPAPKANAEPCWNRLRIRGHLCWALFRTSNLQLKIRYHDPLNKHPGDDYFTIYFKKVLL